MSRNKRIVTADSVIEIESIKRPRRIKYATIVAAAKVEQDDLWKTPWDNCDGFEHELIEGRQLSAYPDDIHNARGFTYCDGHRGNVLITVSNDTVTRMWGVDGYKGASKQVRREIIAREKARAIDMLVNWYSNGWEWWYTHIEFQGYSASCGGIDSYDYANGDMRHEMAAEIVGQLEDDGYIVEGKPDRQAEYKANRRQQFRDKIKRQLAQ